jgi:hypothetical protein
VSLQTGSGKTVSALYALAKVNYRIGIVIIPTYIENRVVFESPWATHITTVPERSCSTHL